MVNIVIVGLVTELGKSDQRSALVSLVQKEIDRKIDQINPPTAENSILDEITGPQVMGLVRRLTTLRQLTEMLRDDIHDNTPTLKFEDIVQTDVDLLKKLTTNIRTKYRTALS